MRSKVIQLHTLSTSYTGSNGKSIKIKLEVKSMR